MHRQHQYRAMSLPLSSRRRSASMSSGLCPTRLRI